MIVKPHAEINDNAIEGALSRLDARMQESTRIYEKLIANGTGEAIGGKYRKNIMKSVIKFTCCWERIRKGKIQLRPSVRILNRRTELRKVFRGSLCAGVVFIP